MIHLVRLKMNFKPPKYKHGLRYRMSTDKIATKTAARQVCWIIQQSPHITHLQLDHLSIFSLKEMELLALTLHGLLWLQEIRLRICTDEANVYQRGFFKIFFALPVSITVCKLSNEPPLYWKYYWHDVDPWNCELEGIEGESELDIDMEDDEESGRSRQDTSDNIESVLAVQENEQVKEEKDQELDIPEVFCRDEPLSQLKKFKAWSMNTLTKKEVLQVFDHCPNVVSLCASPVSVIGEDLEILARSISERCPHLRKLSSKRHPYAALVTAIMEAMSNQQKIEEIKIANMHLYDGMGAFRRAFARHSTTLRKLEFRYASIGNKDLLIILELCESLEVLIQYPDFWSTPILTLADAISVPWACKRIRHLEIAIGLEPVSLSPEELPYYQRPAPVTLLEEEKRQFADLERLYREIGSLVHLEYMDLRGTYIDDEGDRIDELREDSDYFTFPGMFSIRDDETGRPGYLDLLSGLVKLKELRGTVRVTTDEAKATVGDREIEWVANHWPALERVAFFTWENFVNARFERLRDVLRPGLSLSQFPKWERRMYDP
ncbi:hypothetical protein BGZ95_006583, partial [Linnemannia exigua]